MNERKIVMMVLVVVFLTSVTGVAGRNNCFPQWAEMPIIIDKEMNRLEFARGDTFGVESNYGNARDCAYQYRLEVLINGVPSNAIIIKDIHAKRTIAAVSAIAKSGDVVTIRGVFTFLNDSTGAGSEREAKLFIVDRPSPPKINLSYGEIKSFTRFSVNWSGSKAQGGSNNFVYNCSFVLRDEQGNIVDKRDAKADREKERPLAWLTPKNPGIYSLIAACGDSHGVLAAITESIPVDISDSARNRPAIIVNKTLSCFPSKCVVDYSKTNAFDKSIKAEYYDITNGDNRNVPAVPCGSEKCLLNLTKPGVYKIKLKLWFSWYDRRVNKIINSDKSEAVILVTVTAGQGYQRTPAIPIQRQVVSPIVTANKVPYGIAETPVPEYRRKSSPGISFFASIAIVAIMARKIKNKKFKL